MKRSTHLGGQKAFRVTPAPKGPTAAPKAHGVARARMPYWAGPSNFKTPLPGKPERMVCQGCFVCAGLRMTETYGACSSFAFPAAKHPRGFSHPSALAHWDPSPNGTPAARELVRGWRGGAGVSIAGRCRPTDVHVGVGHKTDVGSLRRGGSGRPFLAPRRLKFSLVVRELRPAVNR